jgi:small GTP-binding protein
MYVQRPDRRRFQHKVVLLGDSRVGKTSIIARQTQSFEYTQPNPTIGCHCNEVQVTVDGKPVTLQVWDTAGQEMYRALVPVYLRGADGALIVYDIADKESFASLSHWFTLIVDTLPPETVVFVIANKLDLIESAAVSEETGLAYATARKAGFFTVSALTGQGIDDVFAAMGREIVRRVRTEIDGNQGISLGARRQGGCC